MKSICLPVFVAASGLLLSSLHAQVNNSDIPIEFRPIRNNAFSMGVRIIGGANVKFGNLGTVASVIGTIPDLSAGEVTRGYVDGNVQVDGPRLTEETNEAGEQTSTPGGRYTISAGLFDVDGNPVLDENGNPLTQIAGDLLAYTPGLTRNWSYASDTQTTTPGVLSMHDYSASTAGATASASSGAGAGFEFTASHRFGTIGSSKIDWGFQFGLGITDINGKSSGSIKSNLTTLTDLYRISGIVPPPAGPYTAPSFTEFIGEDGTIYPNSSESTITVASTPFSRTITETPNGAEIDGHWQIKGAYYLFRAGPVVRIPIGPRFAMTFSAGYAGAYIGSKYKAEETLNVSGINPITYSGESEYSKYLHGAYVEANAEWWLTTRTGFFAGATFEKLGKYEQTLGNRTAAIDIGGNGGFRFGITTRF